MAKAPAIAKFLAKYAPEIAAQLRDARNHLAKHFPRGFELVYDNYNALVFAYSPSERASEAILSVAGYPKWVTLFFAKGTTLRDPHNVLEGSGAQFRSVRLQPASRLREAVVQDLIREAKRAADSQLKSAPPLTTIVKAVAAKQRSRRPTRKVPTKAARLGRKKSGAS